MTKRQVLHYLHRAIAVYGSQRAAAKTLGISPQYLCDVLMERREPAGKLLTSLNLRRVVTTTYEVIR
ncbi:MAG TPA: transcriptional regulator [Candidatus Omnitrophica bacterium]|nr:transcriptional regulator [Candidatus Omnitrophota bacterium]